MHKLSISEAFYLKGKIEGRIEGRKEALEEIRKQKVRIEMAKKLKHQGAAIEMIANVTELSVEEIEAL